MAIAPIAPSTDSPGLQRPVFGSETPQVIQDAFKVAFDNLTYIRNTLPNVQAQTAVQAVSSLITSSAQQTPASSGSGGSSSSGIFIVGTHALRLSQYSTAVLGSAYYEIDRCSIYVMSNQTSSNLWEYAAGNMECLVANLPTDLGVADAGFIVTTTDVGTQTQYVWTGSAFVTTGGELQNVADAATSTITTVQTLLHSTSGTATTGFGLEQLYELQNASGNVDQGAAVTVSWTNATAAAATSIWKLLLRNAGAALAYAISITSTTLTYIGNIVLGGIFTTYNNISTAGWGIPAIYAYGRVTAQTAAVSSMASYTVGTNDGSFVISGNISIISGSSTGYTINLVIAYTDENGNSQILWLPFNATLGQYSQVTTVNHTTFPSTYGAAQGVPVHIRCKGGSTITASTSGTFANVDYNAEVSIAQIA